MFILRYLTPQYGCIKNFLRGISLKSFDKAYFKNTKKKVVSVQSEFEHVKIRPFCTLNTVVLF